MAQQVPHGAFSPVRNDKAWWDRKTCPATLGVNWAGWEPRYDNPKCRNLPESRGITAFRLGFSAI